MTWKRCWHYWPDVTGNSPVTLTIRTVIWSFGGFCFAVINPSNLLNKQSCFQCFYMPWSPCDVIVMNHVRVSHDSIGSVLVTHDDVIQWKHFQRYWLFVRGIHRPPLNSPHKVQWRGALIFSLIWAWINGWVNNPESGDAIAPIMTSL